MYYQTTNLKDKERVAFMKQAKSQDDFILKLFQKHDYYAMTPTTIFDLCNGYGKTWPMTSIRRSLNTLSNLKKIEKLNSTSPSMYGRPEHRYKLV